MRSLPEMVASALEAYDEGQALDLARSEAWLEVRDRYAWLSSRLIVNGHEAVARRVDREYQALRDALRRAATSPEKLKVKDDYALWEAATEFHLTVKHLDHLGGRIEELSTVKPAQALPSPRTVPKRSWTQPELDEAIGQYKANRAARFKEMLSVLDNPRVPERRRRRRGPWGPRGPERRKRLVRREAHRMFGRNAVARALGVKSAKMVSQSSVWVQIADTLGLARRRRGRSSQPRTGRQRLGLEIASERASLEAPETATHAAADAALRREERETTLARIRKLAQSGRKDARENAKALYEKYEAGEMTDDQARQTVEVLLEQL